MKKAIALLVAVAAALSISTGVFAAVGGTDIARSLEWAADTTDATPRLALDRGQLVLGYSANGGNIVVLPETFLKPGNEYTYQLFRVDQDYTSIAPNAVALTPVTDAMLDGAKIRIRTVKGSANVVSAKVEKKSASAGGIYQFKIETKETYGTSVNDLEYNLVVSGQSANATPRLLDANVLLKTGYRAMLDDEIEGYGEGDIVTIPDERPVITKSQFETLAKNYSYKAIQFTGEEGDWMFTGRVSGMGSANFLTTYDVVPDIINAYPEQDYKFITFNAGVTFPTNGEMRLDVSDMIDSNIRGADLYTYLYHDGVLTPIATTFDGTSDELVFRTNYLGAFVVTTEEIAELNEPTEPTEPTEPGTEGPGTNPPTGAAGTAGLVALGLVSMAAGFASRRKAKK